MNPHVRLFLRLLAVVICVGLLSAFMVWALHGAHPSARRASFEDERHIAYRADTERGPVFSLDDKSGVLRIQSFLHLPAITGPATYDPERRYKYGLAFLVRDGDGGIVERRTTWLTARNSKADWRDGRWQKAGSYYPAGEGDGEPCDSRLSTIDLRRVNDPDHTLEIRMLRPDRLSDAEETAPPQGAEVNLLVYRRFTRSGDQLDWRRRTLSRKRQRELAGRAGFDQWHQMSAEEQRRAVRFGWRRMSTISETPVRALYRTGFRVPVESLAPRVGEPLRAGEKLAYNVTGPTTLHLGLLTPPQTGERGRRPRAISISVLAADPSASPPIVEHERSVTLRAAESTLPTAPRDVPAAARARVSMPEGRSGTIRVTLEKGAPVRVMAWLEGETAPLGRTPKTRVTERFSLTGPDWATFYGWEAGPEGQPVEFVVAGDGGRVGEALRISARPILDETGTNPTLTYTFVGDDRRRRETISLEAHPAPFERLEAPTRRPADARAARPAVGQPSYHRLWVPDWADRLRIAMADGRAVVDLATLPDPDDYPEPKLATPYAPPPDRLEWRYALHRVYPWQTLEPSNAAALVDSGRRRRYEAQVRLQPDWDAFTPEELERAREVFCPPDADDCRFAEAFEEEDEQTTEHTVVVRPDTGLRSGVVVEPADLQPDDAPSLRRLAREWSTSWRLGLRAGAPVRCRAPRNGRLAIDYRLEDRRLLGKRLDVHWQGAPVASTMMRVDRDRLAVDAPGGTGTLELRVPEGADGALRARVDCRPVAVSDAATVWRLRQVHPLDPGETLTVDIYTGEQEAPGLNILAYPTAGLRQFRLESSVDGGDPPRRTDGPVDQLTDPQRTLEFTVPAHTRNHLRRAPDTRLAGPVHQFVPMGTDWKPGWHEVALTLPKEADGRVWLRFFILASDAQVARKNRREGN